MGGIVERGRGPRRKTAHEDALEYRRLIDFVVVARPERDVSARRPKERVAFLTLRKPVGVSGSTIRAASMRVADESGGPAEMQDFAEAIRRSVVEP